MRTIKFKKQHGDYNNGSLYFCSDVEELYPGLADLEEGYVWISVSKTPRKDFEKITIEYSEGLYNSYWTVDGLYFDSVALEDLLEEFGLELEEMELYVKVECQEKYFYEKEDIYIYANCEEFESDIKLSEEAEVSVKINGIEIPVSVSTHYDF